MTIGSFPPHSFHHEFSSYPSVHNPPLDPRFRSFSFVFPIVLYNFFRHPSQPPVKKKSIAHRRRRCVAPKTMTNWKNVNNWHWVERDCTEWSKTYLREALTHVTYEGAEDGMSVSVEAVDRCEGEAHVNQRKGRIMAFYDFELKLGWKGKRKVGGAEGAETVEEGTIEIPEVSQDQDSDEIEVRMCVCVYGWKGRNGVQWFNTHRYIVSGEHQGKEPI